jgi:hypothetical protein
MSLNKYKNGDGWSLTYQCPLTSECQNNKCFWKQRDCFGLQPFPVYQDEDGNWPAMEKNVAIQEEFGDSYFPEHIISVGTNDMIITCKDRKF